MEEEERNIYFLNSFNLVNSTIKDLVAVSENIILMKIKVMKRAKEFCASNLLHALHVGLQVCLGDALLLIDTEKMMRHDSMLSHILAMTV